MVTLILLRDAAGGSALSIRPRVLRRRFEGRMFAAPARRELERHRAILERRRAGERGG